MRKRNFTPALMIVSLAWMAFFVHACSAGPIFHDPTSIGEIAAAPRIQVALTKFLRVEKAPVRVAGRYAISVEKDVLERGDRLEATVAWENGIKINDRIYAGGAVRILCDSDGDLEVGGARYRGDLLIVADEDRQTKAPRITLVNDVDMEDYLKGVVGKEMPLSAGVEALKAQVIASRTYAVYDTRQRTLRTVKGEKFDLYDDERSQVYGGRDAETPLARRLVDETRGMFLTWEGKLFKAFYSSTCGGHTEPAKLILGGEGEMIPPLMGAPCGFCEGSKYYRWTASFSRAELSKQLFPDKPRLEVRSVRISKTLPGGHALEVAVGLEGTSREVLLHANEQFRRRIDPRKIRSTLWDKIELTKDSIVFEGRGWGHGAGLCQVGAYRQADAGRTATEILTHYYPKSEVRKLY